MKQEKELRSISRRSRKGNQINMPAILQLLFLMLMPDLTLRLLPLLSSEEVSVNQLPPRKIKHYGKYWPHKQDNTWKITFLLPLDWFKLRILFIKLATFWSKLPEECMNMRKKPSGKSFWTLFLSLWTQTITCLLIQLFRFSMDSSPISLSTWTSSRLTWLQFSEKLLHIKV